MMMEGAVRNGYVRSVVWRWSTIARGKVGDGLNFGGGQRTAQWKKDIIKSRGAQKERVVKRFACSIA